MPSIYKLTYSLQMLIGCSQPCNDGKKKKNPRFTDKESVVEVRGIHLAWK